MENATRSTLVRRLHERMAALEKEGYITQPHTSAGRIPTNRAYRLLVEGADLLTGFPLQKVGTWGERFIVPFFSWAVYCFTPLALALSGLLASSGSMYIEHDLLFDAIRNDKPYNEVKSGVEACVVCNMGRRAAHLLENGPPAGGHLERRLTPCGGFHRISAWIGDRNDNGYWC